MFYKVTLTGAFVGLAALSASSAWAEMLDVDGGQIYYETVGEGMPIMVMHGGLGLDSTYLRPYFDQLSDLGQVIYLDHRGNGRSSRPDDYSSITMETMIDDAEALRQHLGGQPMVLIGHSWGGFIAQEYAIKYQDNLAGLVLVDTVPVFDYAPTLSGTEEQMAALGELFSRPTTDDEDMRSLWNTVIPMYFQQGSPELFARLDAATTYSANAWNNAGGILANFNTLDDLPNVQTKTLAVAGAHDGITPYKPGALRIFSIMPNADVTLFYGSGHYPFIEEEEEFFSYLRNWISGL